MKSTLIGLWGVCLLQACSATPPPSKEPAASERKDSAGSRKGPSLGSQSATTSPTHEEAIWRIAKDIEAQKGRFPQLGDFSARAHCDQKRLVVSYGFKTHRSTRRGGWTAGVPNPDPDGIWFYVDFHDPSSQAQIHTQPVVAPMFLGGKKVMVLILEGEKTTKFAPVLHQILLKHGVRLGR